ncbi:hypothetical protein GSF22_33160 [Micromonospora echinofusca]|uniref:Uncharacterized protein n=2 Tax=Micromonospora echinofusca TaxID=47858 RepID=A0ABS3W284_MICEH|nr:hypothetical protein [Micromonospora echinofusca]
MRRLIAVTAVAVAMLAGAGCSADREGAGGTATPGVTAGPTGTPGTGPTTPPGAGPGGSPAGGTAAPAGGNGREVCDAAIRAGSTAVQTYVSELGTMLTATGAGDTKTAEAARQRAEAALKGWRTELTRQSALATDARLKTVLAEIAAEVGTMKADINSIDSDKLDQLQQRLDQLCAG